MSKKLRFVDGTELQLLAAFGRNEYFRDTTRDVIEFCIDPSIMPLDEIDALFTAENCAALVLVEEEAGDTYTHEVYSERVSLSKCEKTAAFDGITSETRVVVCVKMAKKSEAEELRGVVDDLLIEVLGV